LEAFMNATQTYPQVYRTTCIPTESRLITSIPSEYIGQRLEIIVLPQYEEPPYNEENLKKPGLTKARGGLRKYANPNLIPFEKETWEKVAVRKYAKQ